MKLRILLAIFTACLTLSLGSAHAQDEALNKARQAFDSGQSLFSDEKFIEAADKFLQAYAAKPFPQFLFNIAACYEKAKSYEDALRYYQKYLDTKPKEKNIVRTNKRVDALKKAVEQLKLDPTGRVEAVEALEKIKLPGLVVILSEPTGATIYLDNPDGAPLSTTPYNGSLVGKHKLYTKADGYKTDVQEIRLDPNKIMVFKIGLSQEHYLGTLKITANIPDANIYIDDKAEGAKATAPWSGEVEPGKHKVWITKNGYSEFETEIEVIAGETISVTAELEGAEVGYLNVRGTGTEYMKVYVDGKLLCDPGPCVEPLEPGKHKVSIRRAGHRSYNKTVQVRSSTEVTLRPRLAKSPSRTDAVVAYLFAAGFAGGGYYFTTKANSLKDEFQLAANGTPPADNRDPRLGMGGITGKNYAIAADVMYVIGGATLLTAIYYTFRDKGKKSTGSTDIRATGLGRVSFESHVTPNYAGFGLAGTF